MEKEVSAILAFEFTPNQTRINPECSPKVPRRYYEGTTEVLPRNFTLAADALAGALIVKARRRKGVKSVNCDFVTSFNCGFVSCVLLRSASLPSALSALCLSALCVSDTLPSESLKHSRRKIFLLLTAYLPFCPLLLYLLNL